MHRHKLAGVFTTVLLMASSNLSGEEPKVSDEQLNKVIAAMRNIDPKSVKPEERESKAQALQKAWETVLAAGARGAARLNDELDVLQKSKEKDDFFSLGACVLLWRILKLDAADRIACVWATADVSVNYNYVFGTAFDAARTRDPRVFPMLRALLRDKKGSYFVQMHSLKLDWPLNQRFLWGVLGPSGRVALHKVLSESQSPEELETAMLLLSDMHYKPALPDIRRLCGHKSDLVRAMALEALGNFGHPDDWEVISQGLGSKDPKAFEWHAIAARGYMDLRAAEALIPHLTSGNERERGVTVWALTGLPCPKMLEALDRYAAKVKQQAEKKRLQRFFDGLYDELDCAREQYWKESDEGKAKAFAALYAKRKASQTLQADDRKLTREDFLRVIGEWKKNHRISGGIYKWVYDRHVLSVATAEDIPALLTVRAYVMQRLSDECLYEVRTLDRLVRHIGRSRYRKEPDLTPKVESVP